MNDLSSQNKEYLGSPIKRSSMILADFPIVPTLLAGACEGSLFVPLPLIAPTRAGALF